MLGGSTDILGHNALSSYEMYDTRVRVWTQIASMHIPRFAAGVATVSGRIYVFGRSCNGESFKSVELLSGIERVANGKRHASSYSTPSAHGGQHS